MPTIFKRDAVNLDNAFVIGDTSGWEAVEPHAALILFGMEVAGVLCNTANCREYLLPPTLRWVAESWVKSSGLLIDFQVVLREDGYSYLRMGAAPNDP